MEQTTPAHEYIRQSGKALAAMIDNIEDEVRRMRRVLHDLYASADDVQTLEEDET